MRVKKILITMMMLLIGVSQTRCSEKIDFFSIEMFTTSSDILYLQDFDDHIKKGMSEFYSGAYDSSLKYFEKAHQVRFFEDVNWKTYFLLSYVYTKLNKLDRAKEYYEKSQIILKIISGIYKCEDNGDNIYLVDNYSKIITDTYSKSTGEFMCNEFTINNFYGFYSFEEISDFTRFLNLLEVIKFEIGKLEKNSKKIK